jgi:hypothetical protein
MFEAIQRVDRTSLCALAKNFVKTRNDPAALLCLDHVFSSPLELQNLPLVKVYASLSLYLDYIRLLNKFRRDESLVQGSNNQRLFGFQDLGGDRYLVPEHTLLHEKLTKQSGPSKRSANEYRCGHDELSRVINKLISGRIDNRTEIQNTACREIHGFSPCLQLLVQKECNPPEGKGPCTFQHIQSEQLTVDWYRTRIRLILLQFQILGLARYYDWDVRKCVLVKSARNTR